MYAALRKSRSPAALRPLSFKSRTMSSYLTRPSDWKARAPAPLPGPAFAGQVTLPKLPVPELSETLIKLKDSLKPIAWDEREYAAAVKKIDEFSATLGPELQKRLQQRKEETEHWFEEWWDDVAYMAYRDSVCPTLLSLTAGIRLHEMCVYSGHN